MAKAKGEKRNQLTAAQKFELMYWLKGLHGDGTLAGMTIKAVLDAAAKAFTFPVTRGNVWGVCDAMGWGYARDHTKSRGSGLLKALADRVDELERLAADLVTTTQARQIATEAVRAVVAAGDLGRRATA